MKASLISKTSDEGNHKEKEEGNAQLDKGNAWWCWSISWDAYLLLLENK